MDSKSFFRAPVIAATLFAVNIIWFSAVGLAQDNVSQTPPLTQRVPDDSGQDQTARPPTDEAFTLHIKAAAGSPTAHPAMDTTTPNEDGKQTNDKSNIPPEQRRLDELRRLAEQGIAGAQFNLAEEYLRGKIKHNPTEAARWFRRSAEQNFGNAQSELGQLYFAGQGVKRNYSEAYFWFLLAPKYKSDDLIIYDPAKAARHLTSAEKATVEARAAKWELAHPRKSPPHHVMPSSISPPK